MPALPQSFEGFVVLDALESGPLSDVMLAEDTSLGRKVILKALKPTISPDSTVAASLEREAAILANLSLRVVPTLYRVIRTEKTLCLVLAHKPGRTLRTLVSEQKTRPSAASVRALSLLLFSAIFALEQAGVVHGDIKPDNLLITDAGELVLLDFGAAWRTGESLPNAAGTRAYLAPERVLGQKSDVRSDLFSVGVVLYELAAGERPEVLSGSRLIPLHRKAPFLDRNVERVIMRCLERHPHDRFLSAKDALGELGAHEEGSPRFRLEDEVPAPPKQPAAAARKAPFVGLLLFGAFFSLIVAWMERGTSRDLTDEGRLLLVPTAQGYLRVNVIPWADVTIDGQFIDTTPVARKLPLSAGEHFATFRHPKFGTVRRHITIRADQTTLVEVHMQEGTSQ